MPSRLWRTVQQLARRILELLASLLGRGEQARGQLPRNHSGASHGDLGGDRHEDSDALRQEVDSGPRVPSIPIASGLAADVLPTLVEPATVFRSPRVTGVPAIAKRLQLRTAATILSAFDILVIPWPLAERLLRWDAPFAFAHFCRDFGIDVGALLRPSHRAYESSVDRLREVCDLLVAAEQTSQGSGLPLTPFLEIIRTDVDLAPRTLDSIAMLSQALRLTASSSLRWRMFLAHRDDVLRRCGEWQLLSEDDVTSLCEDCFAYRDIEQRCGAAIDRFSEALNGLRRSESTIDVAEDFLSTFDALRADLESGERDDPNEAIGALETLADLADSAINGDAPGTEDSLLEDQATSHLAVLGLPADASEELAQQTWRRLIGKWHPDRHPPERREEAANMTTSINEAYTALRRIWNNSRVA